MRIEKLPSGSYRMRKMYKGKMYTVVTDYKPTRKEAIQLMADQLNQVQENHKRMTFRNACETYIESKRNVLSPATVRGYKCAAKALSDGFLDENIHDITAAGVQVEINRLAKDHSPKTVRNYHGFISAVLGVYCPRMKLYTTLPQKIKNEPYIPSDSDIKQILEYAKGSQFEIPIILACYGLRRSEICALTADDVDGDAIKISRAKVLGDKADWVDKTTKTTASTREIIIPQEIAEKIREQGYVYRGHPNSITIYLAKAEDKLGLPRFSLHKLRHYFASKMSALNIPEADIMRMGGWETDHVMKRVYRHSMMDKEEKAKREAAEKLKSALFS